MRLGAPLDIRLTAQGVENAAVLPTLASAGVAGCQGNLGGAVSLWRELIRGRLWRAAPTKRSLAGCCQPRKKAPLQIKGLELA